MRIFKSIICLIISLVFLNKSYGYYDINNYEINWDILIDWTININEKIDTNFYTEMHWIERILNKFYNVLDLKFQVFYNNIKVHNDNHTTYDEYWNTVIRIGDADKTIKWEHEYNIDYSMYWVIRNFSWMWYSELYWNVIGYERDVSIKNSIIKLNLPKAYTWLTKEDFKISAWITEHTTIDDFPWEITRDDNSIYIKYNWELSPYNWITLAIKFPNNYFIYDHERQEKLFAWYIRDFKVKNNKIRWVVNKNWRIDFSNNIEIEKYQEINYIRWNIPYKVYQNYKPKLTILENLKINWKESDYEKYDTTYYNQLFNINELSWDKNINSEYSLYWLITVFTWEDPNRTNRITLPLPIFSLNEESENMELELIFSEKEFWNICSWIYKEDIELKVLEAEINIEDFYNNWWSLRCENNTLFFNTNNLYDTDNIQLNINLTDIGFELDKDLLEALEKVWEWEFYYNDSINKESIILLLIMIISCWWFIWYMKNRYKKQWKEKLKYIVEYDAPKWMDSPEVWALIDDVINPKDITALIYQWASTKYIEIQCEEKDNNKFYIKKLKQLPSTAKSYQLKLFNNIFCDNSVFHFEKDNNNQNNKLYKHIKEANNWLKDYINSEGRYTIKFEYAKSEKESFKTTNKTFVWCTAFLWIILYSITITIINSYLKPAWSWLILFNIIWIILILTSYKRKDKEVYTDKWNKLLKHCMWYKEFLMRVDKDKFKTLTKKDPLFVEKALPYAVVFWIETEFIKNITPEKDFKIYGWDIDTLLTSISYFNKTINQNLYTYTSYSSSTSSYSYSSTSWHSSWSSFSWWYSSWGWGWWWGWRWR